MTSPTGMRNDGNAGGCGCGVRAFTLLELIVVMALLATLMAWVAPSLSRSIRQRHLQEEAVRLVALTEVGRSEAVSRGLPMVVWLEPATGRFGLEARTGFRGLERLQAEYWLGRDVRFDLGTGWRSPGVQEFVEFGPDGVPALGSVEAVWLVDRFDSSVVVALGTNRWGYDVLRPWQYEERLRQPARREGRR
jgi:prepilin-type N-terminal cleavage/methylation domain-containing protein